MISLLRCTYQVVYSLSVCFNDATTSEHLFLPGTWYIRIILGPSEEGAHVFKRGQPHILTLNKWVAQQLRSCHAPAHVRVQ